MAKITVYKKDGKKAGNVEVNSDIFESQINVRLLNEVNRLYANNKRTGTAHTKTRKEVRGGSARPWRQKGTGRARVSSIRSPLWRGGGTIFGPRQREIYNTIPKQLKIKALISALSKKFKENNILVVDDLSLDSHKTKEFFKILENLNIDNKNTLFLVEKLDDNVQKASRNIYMLSLKKVCDVNAYHILRKSILLMDKDSIKALEKRIVDRNRKELQEVTNN